MSVLVPFVSCTRTLCRTAWWPPTTGSVTRNRVPRPAADAEVDAAVVRVHDLPDDGQPEAGALRPWS